MPIHPSVNVTGLLEAWGKGSGGALDELVAIVYPEIRRLARHHLHGRSAQDTLESAAIANEAYMRLNRAHGVVCENRIAFLALCGTVVRRVIGEYARSRRYEKRGGRAVHVPLDEGLAHAADPAGNLLDLHEALERLEKVDARKLALVEQHCFAGLTIEECAQLLGISPETAKRDWKAAKAWLRVQLGGNRQR